MSPPSARGRRGNRRRCSFLSYALSDRCDGRTEQDLWWVISSGYSSEQRTLKCERRKCDRGTALLGTLVIYCRRAPPLHSQETSDSKALVCHSDRAFCWHVVQKGGGQRVTVLCRFLMLSPFSHHCVTHSEQLFTVHRSASCVLSESGRTDSLRHPSTDSLRDPSQKLLSLLQEIGKPPEHDSYFFKGPIISYSYRSW